MLFRACVDGGERRQVAYPVPTYSLYDTLAAIQGSERRGCPSPVTFICPPKSSVSAGARLTIICSPNSPSGTAIPLADIEAIARRASGLVVVDEAYVDFADETALPLVGKLPNVVVLRSFSKSFSLAGMRIGLGLRERDGHPRARKGQKTRTT